MLRGVVDDYVTAIETTKINRSLNESVPLTNREHVGLVLENARLKQENFKMRVSTATPNVSLNYRSK